MDSHGDPGPSTMENRTLAQAPRVSQVDADDLDESLVSMLSERLQKSLGNFKTTHGLDLRPELSLVLKLVIFRYGVWDQTILASPGAKLQNLRLASPSAPYQKPSRNLLLLYLLLHPPILPTYILTRIRQHALSQQWPDLPQRDWRKKAWKAVVWGENVARAWELLGWTWFLFDGKYPSILMRILKLRLVPSSPHLTKLVSYEFMNRQLVWSTFTEFLMFSVPLLPPVPDYLRPAALVAPIKAVFEQPKSIDYSSITLEPSANSEKSSAGSTQAHAGPYASLPLSTCPICYSRRVSKPVSLSDSVSGARISLPRLDQVDGEDVGGGEERIFVPAQTDCWGGCRWCYYCIAGELAEFEAKSTKTAKPVKPASTAQRGVKGVQEEKMEEEVKWDCLRCGGGATKAWRVGGTRPEVKSEA